MENNPFHSANIALFNILWDDKEDFPIFYQVDRFFRCSTPITCQKDSTHYFQEILKCYFNIYNSQDYSKPEMRQSMGNIICSLFKLFKEEKVAQIEDENIRWRYLEDWGILTQLALYEVYFQITKSESPDGTFLSNRDLFKSASVDIDDQVCLALKEEYNNKYPEYSLPLLYKLDEKGVADGPNGQHFHTTLEKAMAEELFNKEFFVREFIKYYNEAIQNVENKKTVQLSALEYIEQQFSNFTRQARQSGCYDSKALRLAAMYWRYSTNSLIKRQSTIQQIDILIENNFVSESLIDGGAPKMAIDACTAINELKNECISYVNTMLDSYLEELDKGRMNYPWSDQLESVGIDYNGLYSDMKGEYFSQSISIATFKDAFISADFKSIYEEAKCKSRSICILFLILRLSEYIKDGWGEKAALSIYKDETSDKNAFRKLQKNANPKSECNKEFDLMLMGHIRVLEKCRRK